MRLIGMQFIKRAKIASTVFRWPEFVGFPAPLPPLLFAACLAMGIVMGSLLVFLFSGTPRPPETTRLTHRQAGQASGSWFASVECVLNERTRKQGSGVVIEKVGRGGRGVLFLDSWKFGTLSFYRFNVLSISWFMHVSLFVMGTCNSYN